MAIVKEMSVQDQVFATMSAEDVLAQGITKKTKRELSKLLGPKTKAEFKTVNQ